MSTPTDTTGGRVLDEAQARELCSLCRGGPHLQCVHGDVRRAESAVIAALSATPLDVEAIAEQCWEASRVIHNDEDDHGDPIADLIRRALATQAAQLTEARAQLHRFQHGAQIESDYLCHAALDKLDLVNQLTEAQQRAEAAAARVRELEVQNAQYRDAMFTSSEPK